MSRPDSAAGRPSTPSSKNRNLANIRKAQMNMNGSRSNDNVLASLRATQIVASKPVLPAELIATILDYLPVPDLIRCARASRRLQEMVYDDTRWNQKLRQIGVWNEAEARQRVEQAMRRKVEAQRAKEIDESKRTSVNLPGSGNGVTGHGRRHAGSVTLFDAGVEEERYRQSQDTPRKAAQRNRGLADGFDDLTIGPASAGSHTKKAVDPTVALTVLDHVRSVRGHAREEYAKVHAALGPLYSDLAKSRGHSDPLIFRTYRAPEQQAQILSQLKRFAKGDDAEGWREREAKLDSMIGMFETAVFREFEQGLAADDVDGRMKRYAHVLVSLNGGSAAIDAFISNNAAMDQTSRSSNLLRCLEDVAPGHVDLNPSQAFFESLAANAVEQAAVIDRVFPATVDVLTLFIRRLSEEVVSESLTTLFDEAHNRGLEPYVKTVSGTFAQALRFVASLVPSKASPADFADSSKRAVIQCFEKHLDLYLTEELAFFKDRSSAQVSQWEKELSEQEANAESFFMSNVQRQAAKRDFLSSFKKVVMMPVTAFPLSSPFGSAKPAPNRAVANVEATEPGHTRPSTPTLTSLNTPNRSSTPQIELPTTELAAKAAIMNSRLEGIKTLFSIEVALNLTHLAKASIERTATLVKMEGKQGEAAKEQCEAIFVELLTILGTRHIRNGFDKAVEHLGSYNPRDVRSYRAQTSSEAAPSHEPMIGVEPLMTFLELVNVGDLIQQMVDVFYQQELIATKLTDRDDFLDPAVKEKKRFEQMLDERVAAGLNKGIDVLISEVEYLCATTQLATDFNPLNPAADPKSSTHPPAVMDMDISPTRTATRVVDTVASHTSMLLGSTDKTILDVFLQEVGLRLFGSLCKHFKRQRISASGAVKLISDINHYSTFVNSLRQKPLVPYYAALRELGQIYLVHIDPPGGYFGGGKAGAGKRASLLSTKASTTSLQAKELATIIADTQRYYGVFPAEEVYEFAERRADWYAVRGDVERAMYGVGCSVM